MIPLIESPNRYPGRRRTQRAVVVVHDMETPRDIHVAEQVGQFFQDPARKASAHVGCDSNSSVQYVKLGDTAWAAPHLNSDGYHIEHAGYARDSRAQWLADMGTLKESARMAAHMVLWNQHVHGIHVPVRRLTIRETASGNVSGFCGHADGTAAYNVIGGHTDPGLHFPWDIWLPKVAAWVKLLDHPGWQSELQ